MLEIAICDDEKLVTANIEKMLEALSAETDTKVNIDVFYDGSTLVNHIKNGKRYDLIYLDIEMAQQNGVDAAREIRLVDINVLIIYVTIYESYAKEVFEVAAFRFITKPINQEIFRKYFLDAKKEILGHPRYFRYQYYKVDYRMLIEEIMYFESDKRVTNIVTNNGRERCYAKIKDIEKCLVESGVYFYRTHQSFLVNPQYVRRYSYTSMELWDGTILSISENRRKSVNKLFCTLKGEDIIV